MDSIIIFCAKYLFVTVPLLFIFAWWQAAKAHKKQLLLAVAAAIVIAAVLDKVGGKLYYDPRPFTHGIKPLITHSADNGFPSEHTLFSMTIAGVIALHRRRLGSLALGVALIVGLARMAAHVHSLVDIVGATVMGLAAAYAGFLLAKKYFGSKRSGGRSADSK
jgi:undecaprenyl-diphosphatase